MKITITHMTTVKASRKGVVHDGVVVYARQSHHRFIIYYWWMHPTAVMEVDASFFSDEAEKAIKKLTHLSQSAYFLPMALEIHNEIHADEEGKPRRIAYAHSSLIDNPDKIDHFSPRLNLSGLEEV